MTFLAKQKKCFWLYFYAKADCSRANFGKWIVRPPLRTPRCWILRPVDAQLAAFSCFHAVQLVHGQLCVLSAGEVYEPVESAVLKILSDVDPSKVHCPGIDFWSSFGLRNFSEWRKEKVKIVARRTFRQKLHDKRRFRKLASLKQRHLPEAPIMKDLNSSEFDSSRQKKNGFLKAKTPQNRVNWRVSLKEDAVTYGGGGEGISGYFYMGGTIFVRVTAKKFRWPINTL